MKKSVTGKINFCTLAGDRQNIHFVKIIWQNFGLILEHIIKKYVAIACDETLNIKAIASCMGLSLRGYNCRYIPTNVSRA